MKRLLLLLALLLSPALASAQTYTLAPAPFQTFQDNSGIIINNGCVWTYAAGTTTPIATYSDNIGTSNTNPIRSDSAGRFTAYLLAGTSYKFVYESNTCSPPSTHGTVLRTADNIGGVPASASSVDDTALAGENLTAGDCAYLSAGDGSKTTGSWYHCDATNVYSSASAVGVGLVVNSITSGGTGAVRVQGRLTTAVAVTPGTNYFISGTPGAITLTPPANRRLIGRADTTATIIIDEGPSLTEFAYAMTNVVQGCLTITTGVCFNPIDVLAATTLYYTPYQGNRIALYTGTSWIVDIFPQLSIAVPSTTSQMYDAFIFDTAGAPALEVLAWTSDTARATALVSQDGVLVKSGATTRRYVGSFRTTAVSGQTEDSFAKRFVWNYYNRARSVQHVADAAGTWTYTMATLRQANANTADQLAFIVGIAEDAYDCMVIAQVANSAGGVAVQVAVGDSSTTVASGVLGQFTTGAAGAQAQVVAHFSTIPAIGYHFYAWLELSAATPTTTWSGQTFSGIFGTYTR